VERAALQRGEAFGSELAAAVDEARLLGAVEHRLLRYLVVVGLVGLAEVGGVRVRNGALLLHPVQRRARVEAAGKGDADLLAEGKMLQDGAHGEVKPCVRERVFSTLPDSPPTEGDRAAAPCGKLASSPAVAPGDFR
jgi:hypothetical protein